MKLRALPTELPIEAINHVVLILATLISSLKDIDLFVESSSMVDYQETLKELNRDLDGFAELYDEWQHDEEADAFQDALTKMHLYLEEAKALVKSNPQKVH